MTALSDAAQAVEAAAGEIGAAAQAGRGLAQAVAAFERAVRRHDAETVRAIGPEAMVGQYARDTIANLIDPKEPR